MTYAALLAERAATHGDRTFLHLAEGRRTFAEADADATRLAHGLAGLGVAPGALVASLLPNCLDAALLPFAVARAGAVHAPVNTAFRGRVLAHVLNLTRAEVLLVDATLAGAVAELGDELAHVRTVVVRGDAAGRLDRFDVLPVVRARGRRRRAARRRRTTRSAWRCCCSRRARPGARRAACSPTATPCGRPSC